MEHRFQRDNRSRGRKKGSKNKLLGLTVSEQIELDEAYRKLEAAGGISVLRAVHRSRAKNAITGTGGGINAQKHLIERVAKLEQKSLDYRIKVLEAAESFLIDCRRWKLTVDPQKWAAFEKMLILHPDDMEIDWNALKVYISGPANVSERRFMDQALEQVQKVGEQILEMRATIRCSRNDEGFIPHLLFLTDRYAKWNRHMPERYRLPPMPPWKSKAVDNYLKMGPEVDWSGVGA